MKKNHFSKRGYTPFVKFDLKMKLTTLFVFASIFSMLAKSGYSQSITLDVKNETVAKIIDKIEATTEYRFVYNTRFVDLKRKTTLKAERTSIEDVLHSLFNNTNTTYKVNDRQVILKEGKKASIISEAPIIEIQKFEVKGTVTDANGQPLPGANILEKGTSNGTQTDFDGNFSLSVENENATLVVSYLGYTTSEVVVNGQSTLSVVLQEDAASLDEVILVGYGSQLKSELTGAVSSVNTEELTKATSATVDNALVGKVAGVQVSTNSAGPGGGMSVRIRGVGGVNNSEPLYVVDGIPISVGPNENSSPLSSINPKDIESISVLKDAASAAIYGARAANGVVLINTKRGKGGRSTININASQGFQSLANSYDLMDASTYAQFINDAAVNAGNTAPFTNPSSFGKGTEWMEVVTQTASVSDLNASFSGSNDNGNYFLSLGYFDQEGIVIGSSFKRLSLVANGDLRLSDKFRVGSSISVSRSKQIATGNPRAQNGNTIFDAAQHYPTLPVYDGNGDYAPTPNEAPYKARVNPLFDVEQLTPQAPEVRNLRGTVYLEYDILPSLTFKTSGSYTYGNTLRTEVGRIYELGLAISDMQTLLKEQRTGSTWLIENTLNYKWNNEDHNFDAIVGQSAQESEFENLRASGSYSLEGNELITTDAQFLDLANRFDDNSLMSYFGRLNYGYKGKYLITANLRFDASSRFGANNKWGTFPSVSAGWNIHKEDFFPEEGVVNSLKLRGGWGQVGNDNIGNYEFSTNALSNFPYSFSPNGTRFVGTAIDGVPNPDLKWETVTQYGVGIDAELFSNRLTLTAEYYNKKQTDMLVNVPQSAVTGLSGSNGAQGVLRQNIGELTNSGLEFSASYRNQIGDLTYSVGANITTINNKVTELGPNGELFSFFFSNFTRVRTYEGGELGEFYGWEEDGIFQNQGEVDAHATQNAGTAPGDIRFKDLNNDGVIDDADRTSIGSPVPDFTYGFNINLEYKDFDFSVQANGVQGNDVYNLTKSTMLDNTSPENKGNFVPWTASNPTNYPRAIQTDPNENRRSSSYYVEDGSYMRIRLIQLGYTLPSNVSEKVGVSNLRLYTSVQNPFTFTSYSGVDPEVGVAGNNNNLSSGLDHFVYPIARIFTFGVNISL
ncbi:TonB-dependent receptor [Seonamhaeicola marinus]|uniref:TonB-dependent receptor n=2 Tax=Seonamhaeicola marinus TaxID=1912246 RepID=A0A5D0HT94_9FLAO|nr:TonB-dependent receptor [Seonamhaeicola marinus]